MAISYFNREDEKPTVITFENSLNVNEFRLWRKFSGNILSLYPNVQTEWLYLSNKIGWFLQYKSEDELLFYVVPDGLCFQVNFMMDDAAFAAAQALNLPEKMINHIKAATATDQGHSFYWAVRDTKDLEIIELLTQVEYETNLKANKEDNKR